MTWESSLPPSLFGVLGHCWGRRITQVRRGEREETELRITEYWRWGRCGEMAEWNGKGKVKRKRNKRE